MSEQHRKRGFAARPSSPDDWVQAPGNGPAAGAKADGYTARLTVDVTPELRGRIKIEAFRRGLTVADMLRTLLEREFPTRPNDSGTAS